MKKKNYFRIIQVNLQVKIFSFEKKSIHGTKNFCRSVFNYS